MSGKRYNEGKPQLALIPAAAEIAEARVWTYGAKKYGENYNWYKGGPALSYTEILNSMARHMNAIKAGEDVDPETGEHHAASIRCNAAMLIQWYVEGRVEQDDRMGRGEKQKVEQDDRVGRGEKQEAKRMIIPKGVLPSDLNMGPVTLVEDDGAKDDE